MKITSEMVAAFNKAYDASLEMQPRETSQAIYDGLSAALQSAVETPAPSSHVVGINWDNPADPVVKTFVGFDVEGYVAEYELVGDNAGGDYTPTEHERMLLTDAIYGVVSNIHESLRKLIPSVTPNSVGTVTATSKAMLDVSIERHRQVMVEGWTPAHDDTHTDGSMAQAAAAYALKARSDESHENGKRVRPPYLWPDSWHVSWWKPTDRRRDLVKAASLIIAEIERLDRAALAATATEDGR